MASEKGVSTQQRSKEFEARLAEAIALYEDHSMPVTAIQEKLGMSQTALYRLLRRGGFKPNAYRSGGGQRVFTEEQDKQVAEEYRQGMSMEQIATKYDVWRKSVKSALRRQGVTLRPAGGVKPPVDPDLVQQLCADWDTGMAQWAIAEKHGLTEARVQRLLRRAAPNAPAKIVRRGWHPNWKGGRRYHMGYVMVLVEQDHPFYSMANSSGYVLEHRLVMAQSLGRPLANHESVHHIDGTRDNNKPENLQLRQGRHGAGVIYHCADCGSLNIVAQAIADSTDDGVPMPVIETQPQQEPMPRLERAQLTFALG